MGKNVKRIDILLFIVLLFVASFYMYNLFYNQAVTTNELYYSDIKSYIEEILGTNEIYSFPYPVLFKTAGFFYLICKNAEISISISLVLFNVIAIIITKVFMTSITQDRILSTISSIALFFSSMIYSPWLSEHITGHYYLGVFSPNAWHNGTYMTARPFMILSFVLGVITVDKYEAINIKKIDKKELYLYIGYSLSLLLSTMAKPSYTIIHLMTMAFIMLYKCLIVRFANIKQSFFYAVLYIPTLIDLLYQYSGVFSGVAITGEERGIGISPFRVWNIYTPNFPVAILLAGAFPIVVLLLHFKHLKTNHYYQFAWELYCVGLVMSILFYEKGFRESHFNFGWGYMCGLFLVFLMSYIILIDDFYELKNSQIKKTSKIIQLGVQLLPMIGQLVLGIRYFDFLLQGGLYY